METILHVLIHVDSAHGDGAVITLAVITGVAAGVARIGHRVRRIAVRGNARSRGDGAIDLGGRDGIGAIRALVVAIILVFARVRNGHGVTGVVLGIVGSHCDSENPLVGSCVVFLERIWEGRSEIVGSLGWLLEGRSNHTR